MWYTEEGQPPKVTDSAGDGLAEGADQAGLPVYRWVVCNLLHASVINVMKYRSMFRDPANADQFKRDMAALEHAPTPTVARIMHVSLYTKWLAIEPEFTRAHIAPWNDANLSAAHVGILSTTHQQMIESSNKWFKDWQDHKRKVHSELLVDVFGRCRVTSVCNNAAQTSVWGKRSLCDRAQKPCHCCPPR